MHLDTSFLIRALLAGTPQAGTLDGWLAAAVAVRSGATVATVNPDDFRRFAPAGVAFVT